MITDIFNTDKKYDVIYADPPWEYRQSGRLLLAAERIKNAQIEKTDAIKLIKSLHGRDVFIYVDPPYLQSTRKKYLYNYEMTDEQHVELLKALCNSTCKIMISGYDNELYEKILKNWNKAIKNTTAECSVRRTETIWMNY